jgi:hypothetical protein
MKKVLLLPTLMLLLGGTPAWAKKNPPRPFMLGEVVLMNGAEIPAGTYQLAMETTGSTVHVTLWKDGQVIATAPGVWAKNGVKYKEDQALLFVNSDGTKSLIEIRIAGAARAIFFPNTDFTVQYSAMKP